MLSVVSTTQLQLVKYVLQKVLPLGKGHKYAVLECIQNLVTTFKVSFAMSLSVLLPHEI